MKYLRMTMWLGRTAEPMTTILCETDMKIPIHTAATLQRQMLQSMPGPLVEVEVHELDDSLSMADAVMTIIQSRPEPLTAEQRHQLTVYDWAVDLLGRLNPEGVVQTTEPSPLTTESLTSVLQRVAAHPAYQDHTFNMEAADGTGVILARGKVRAGRDA